MIGPAGWPLIKPSAATIGITAPLRGSAIISAANRIQPATSISSGRPLRSAMKPPSGTEIAATQSTMLMVEPAAVTDQPRSTISIVLWVAAISVPLGGFIADRSGRPELMLVAGCILFAALMIALPRSGAVIPIVVALGLISGQPAGPIMSLPSRVLQPQTRAIGMGLFFTMFYGCMVLGPVVGGVCAKWAGSAAAAFDFGAAMILLCPFILWAFNRIPQPVPKAA